MKIFRIVSFFLVSVLLLSILGCSCKEKAPETGKQADPAKAKALAERFCPVFYLKAEGTPAESYEPTSVELFVNQAVFHEVDEPSFSLKATILGMKEYFTNHYYLDVPDLSPSAAAATLDGYKKMYDSAKQESFSPTVYTRVIEQSSSNSTIVQYWAFYYFNDWRNIHEGDWELVQLVFPGLPVADILAQNTEPLFAAYSQHQAGQRMDWQVMKEKGVVTDNHPAVYVAQGSHANYFSPGQYWSVLDFDDTGLSSWRDVHPDNIVLLQENSGADFDPEWLDFQGRWGELLGFSVSIRGLTFGQSGPNGPIWSGEGQKSGKWDSAYAWAAGLPEYPDPFWTSFIPEWVKKVDTLAIFSVYSPADIHVYDSSGRHVGLDENGVPELGIVGAAYIAVENTGYKIIVIPDGDVSQGYKMVLKGKGEGKMDVIARIPDARNNTRSFTKYTDVPVTPRMQAWVDFVPGKSFAPTAPGITSTRDTSTVLKIDTDGNNFFDAEVRPGGTEILPIKPEAIPDISPVPVKTTVITSTPPLSVEYKLDIRVEGSGMVVNPDIAGIYKEGAVAVLNAVPESGWVFDRWEGDASGTSAALEIKMDRNRAVVAVFRQVETFLDQANEPPWEGLSLDIGLKQNTRQTFLPRYNTLNTVEVNLLADKAAAGANVTVNITGQDGKVFGSASLFLEAGVNGWVSFSLGEGIYVPVNETLVIELFTAGDVSFRWKYDGNTYLDGESLTASKIADFGDFFFRTWGSDRPLN